MLLGDLRGVALGVRAGIHKHHTRLARDLHDVIEKALGEVGGAEEIGLEGQLIAGDGLTVLRDQADARIVDQHVKLNLLALDLLDARVNRHGAGHIDEQILRITIVYKRCTEMFSFLVSSFSFSTASFALLSLLQPMITLAPARSRILEAR